MHINGFIFEINFEKDFFFSNKTNCIIQKYQKI